MPSTNKTDRRESKSNPDSTGDRRTGSVGEKTELAGTRDSDGRRGAKKGSKPTAADEAPLGRDL